MSRRGPRSVDRPAPFRDDWPVKPIESSAEARTDTSRWQGNDEFAALELVARLKLKTACSMSFELGTRGDWIRVPGTNRTCVMGEGRVFSMIGWLDAHHPCEGSHRLQIRVWLPGRYTCWESMRALLPQVKAAPGLPPGESYHLVCLAGLSEWSEMEVPELGLAPQGGGSTGEVILSPRT